MYARRYLRGCLVYMLSAMFVIPLFLVCVCLPLTVFANSSDGSVLLLIIPIIFVDDPSWAMQFLANTEVTERITRLLDGGDSPADIRQVLAEDGAVWLRLYENRNLFQYEITPDQAHNWIAELIALADFAEQN